MQHVDVLIIGAGLAGCSAGESLLNHNISTQIVEKSSSIGGRLANKRFGGACFDSAKEVFEEIFEGKGNADSIIKEKGLSQISDAKFLEELVSKVISDNPNMVEDYIKTDEGKRKKKLGGFMGQVMQKSKGQANPQQASELLIKHLNDIID